MSLAYSCYFVAVWGSVALAVPLAIVALVLTAVEAVRDHDALAWIVWSAVLVVASMWTILMRAHTPRLLVRAGVWPVWSCGDLYPRTEAELVEGVARVVTRTGKMPTVVGSGWSWFLKRRGPPSPRLFMHRMSGPVTEPEMDEPRWWAAGTPLATVTRFAEKRGSAFDTHPTMESISLGAWFAMGNHGNGGDAASGSSFTLIKARVLDMRTNTIEQLTYPDVRRRFDARDGSRYCIIAVQLKLRINFKLQKKAIVVDSPQAAADWLTPGTQLRVLFVGAARKRYGLGVRWFKPTRPRLAVVDHPHFLSRCCTWLQADVCSAVCGCHEPMSNWDGVTTLANANRWTPPLFPFETLFVVLSGVRNFEVIFTLGREMTGDLLHTFVQTLLDDVHAHAGGRTEIRHGQPGGNTPVFLDCALRSGFHYVFAMLERKFGVKEVALHPGKYTHVSTFPCRRVSLSRVYDMDEAIATA